MPDFNLQYSLKLKAGFDKVFGNLFTSDEEDPIPGYSEMLFWAKNGTTDTIGVSFAGTYPNITMTLSAGCPFLGVGPFVDGGSYDLSEFPANTDNQIFIVDTGTDYKIAIYSTPQTDDTAFKVLRYLNAIETFYTLDGAQFLTADNSPFWVLI